MTAQTTFEVKLVVNGNFKVGGNPQPPSLEPGENARLVPSPRSPARC